ncbi:circularly permuted type 2 ATP-grasp protein [Magnetococcus sp. PR-3]|uniref:circularly permuted type 2 ATP-grasp protein n=1 Tax=Magnetococcus sp. PR-3 TaxID=3120355 RepID=UPI002FCE56CB
MTPNSIPLASGTNASVYDEAFEQPGRPRSHWRQYLDHLYSRGPQLPLQLERDADRLMRELGVTYNLHGGSGRRGQPWPFDPIPLILDTNTWGDLEQGVIQRHQLLSLLHRDLHGKQDCIRQGLIPAELVYGSGSYLFAAHGATPDDMPPLPLYAVDLMRDQDGRHKVVSDRTASPSGHGYVLQNRRVMNRLYADTEQFNNVPVLLPFFKNMRSQLAGLTPYAKQDAHVVLLTSGPANEIYVEHALLAHYLGLILSQGDDLTVRNGRLWIKSLSGLLPVDVILRKVDEAYCDPLELRDDSLLGVVGLTQVARSGRLALANALGTGILENLALHAYLPRLARFFLDEPLQLESPLTLWMGDPMHRQQVADEPDRYVILPARHDPGTPLNGLSRDEALEQALGEKPHAFVARERLEPSRTPSVQRGQITSQPVQIRLYLNSNGQNSQVMPGGLARVSPQADRLTFSPRQGGLSKDIWLMHDKAIEDRGGVITATSIDPAPMVGVPSRVAENLFWLGRYVERAESAIRLFREHLMLQTQETGLGVRQRIHCRNRFLVAFTRVTGTRPGFDGEEGAQNLANPAPELRSALLDSDRPGSLAFSLRAMIQNAFSVRDRLSADTWHVVDDIATVLDRLQQDPDKDLQNLFWETGPLLQGLTAFSGLIWENMYRDLGWRFLDMGRRMERGLFLTHLLETTLGEHADDPLEGAVLERLLALNDSLAAFRMRYRTQLGIPQVLEKLLQDETDPRSLVFQLELMEKHARAVAAGSDESFYKTHLGRVVFEALAAVRLATPEALAGLDESSNSRTELINLLERMKQFLPLFSESASNSYFRHGSPTHLLFKTGSA